MKQKIYSFKHQLEDQQKSSSDNLEKQYKSRISTLEKTTIEKDREIGKLSTTISQTKKDRNDLKKSLASAKKTIKVLDGIIYNKDQTIIAYNEGLQRINPSCIDNTIEPTSFMKIVLETCGIDGVMMLRMILLFEKNMHSTHVFI